MIAADPDGGAMLMPASLDTPFTEARIGLRQPGPHRRGVVAGLASMPMVGGRPPDSAKPATVR
jgi:hypothetical protein